MTLLEELLSTLGALPEEEKKAVVAETVAATADLRWIPNSGPQTEAYFCPADILLYGGQGGGGKALALDTPIATPSGWASMGSLCTGDVVFDDSGHQCKVSACSPVMFGRPCYLVRFSDGSEIVADADHRWFTLTALDRDAILRGSEAWRARRRASRPKRGRGRRPDLAARNSQAVSLVTRVVGGVRTTAAIASTVHHGRGLNHSISVCGALECDPASLPIDPYLFGAWLGDGSSYGARLTIAEPQMAALAASAAESCGWSVRKGATKYDYGVRGGLKVKLREAGVLENKHIPPQYLRASVPQRLALLQGLMDTDGYADPRGQCEYTTTSSKLAADALELINSLGIKAVICEGRAMLRGRDCGPKYRIKFLTELPVFRLDRKLARQKRAGFRGTSARRYIVSVEPVKTVPVRCISVDSPSKLFLCGREMIPTHNSDLGLGLAFTAHRRSLILRRRYTNLGALIDRAVEINGTKDGFNGSPPPKIRTADGRHIEFGANQHLGDEQGWQGQPFDLKVFDEGVQFLESQVRFHIGWLRSTVPGQRVRALLATNPPIDSDGDWIIGMFRPWLDITHPKPAEPGVLRWFVTAPDGADLEVEGPTPVQLGGMKLIPMSRTFIPAELSDNPFLVNTDYQAKLDGLPEPLRSAVRDGNFMAARQDADFQVIPMAWIIAAQDRWKPDGHKAFNMTAMGFDPAGGGADAAELAWRHGGWYAPLITAKGEQTADGSAAAGTIISHRRDSAPVIVDVGGGYGGAVTLRLKDNGIAHSGFNGAAASHARTRDGQLRFANKRAEAWWKFREELDPDQQGGSVICLPPDPELRADLAAPTYEVAARGILIESKEEIRKRLGRSPGKGDACIMALSEGNAAVKRSLSHTGPLQTTANLGYASMKKRR